MTWKIISSLVAMAAALGGLPACATLPDRDAPSIPPGTLPLVRHVDERYQSFQLGFSHLTGGETWCPLEDVPQEGTRDFAQIREPRAATELGNARLRTLTRELAPLYLRFSGTTANSVYFHDSDLPPPEAVPAGFTVMLTRERWRQAFGFARAVDAKVVTSFTNTEGVRDQSHAWTPAMATSLLEYTRSFGGQIYAAELFNEPNAPEPPRRSRGYTADQFARDYASFRRTTAALAPDMLVAGPGSVMLAIPGVAAIGGTSAEDYARAQPKPVFDIVSYHFYPALGSRCAPATSAQGIAIDSARDPGFLARPDAALQEIRALRDAYAPAAPIWLTETGGAACGGLDWQPSFLDTFRYLDTTARLARQGLDAVFTHALISGTNEIIDERTFQPNASYWSAVLWRRLMGTGVLDAGQSHPGLNLYAHRLRGVSGGVVLLAINLDDSPDSISVSVSGDAEVYALTAPDLQGRSVQLNGTLLSLTPNDELPAMGPARIDGRTVAIALASSAFVAFPKANNPACQI